MMLRKLLLALMLVCLSNIATATYIPLLVTSNLDGITNLKTAFLHESLDFVFGPVYGYGSYQQIDSISFQFHSGDGQTNSWGLAYPSTHADLYGGFNYANAGTYNATVDVALRVSMRYQHWVDTSYTQFQGYYQCDFWFFTCISSHWVDTSYRVNQGYYADAWNYSVVNFTDSLLITVIDPIVVPPVEPPAKPTDPPIPAQNVPEPSTVVLLASALIGLSQLRKRKAT